MRERINRLAKGIVDTELPLLLVSTEKIDEMIKMHTRVRKEFCLSSDNNLNLKGLVYSSNSRVRVLNRAFGGLRNHITYEVDTTYLKNKDRIEGCFYLVTNAGERELPFCFLVDLEAAGKALGSFETAEDFAALAKEDMDTALRLFEYPDFVEAPFMQELRVRGIYDSLKGHGSRQGVLEAFLVALKVKEPVKLSLEDQKKQYQNPEGRIEDSITLNKNTWGYTHLNIRTDCQFVQLAMKTATHADFEENSLRIPYTIQPHHLHGGNQFGRIWMSGKDFHQSVKIEVIQHRNDRNIQDRVFYGTHLVSFFNLWMDHQCEIYQPALLQNQMQKELDLLTVSQTGEHNHLLPLLLVQLHLLAHKKDQALMLLDEQRAQILESRQEEPLLYCYYQYLRLMAAQGDEEQKRAFIRLLKTFMDQDPANFYYLKLWLMTDSSLSENPGFLYTHLRQCFQLGNRSPMLYMEACLLLLKEEELLRGVDGFDIQVLLFAMKRGLMTKALALRVAKLSMACKYAHRLQYILLSGLYNSFPEPEILSAVCCLLIKGDLRTATYFPWFEKGVEAGISLTRLYEYYLYALPQPYHKLLPKEILLYFSYENQLDIKSKAVLYCNLLTYMDKEDTLFQSYMRDIEKFTMEQLFASRVNEELAVIYRHMLYQDLIDQPMAKVLPAILNTCQISCPDPSVKYVVVCHRELMTEEAYPVTDKKAYIPLFSDHDLVFFQDGYGNRYGNLEQTPVPVLDQPQLLKQCFLVYPNHPMLCVNNCHRLLEQETLTGEDASFLEHAMEQFRFHPLFQKKLLSKVIAYYRMQIVAGEEQARSADTGYLICLDKRNLEQQERVAVCETLIAQNYFAEAYAMIQEFGPEGISQKRMTKLCAKMVLQNLFDEDDLLLSLSYQIFACDKSDSVILDYLCEHFNGSTNQMYQVLMKAIREHVETYDLEERLVAQMLFTGSTERMDQVFTLYVERKKTGESIVRAYFTTKSMEYFMGEKAVSDKVFEYLEGALHNSVEKDKVPDIYLLALSKYYSTLAELSEEQKSLCQLIVDILLEQAMVFPYFKTLASFIRIPGEIMDKEMIEYHGKKDQKPYLKVRILPGEKEFHMEEMRQVYKGIYIKEKVLFEGEVMEYQVFEEENKEQILKAEGSVVCKGEQGAVARTRFACLNEMSFAITIRDEGRLKERMEAYLIQDQLVRSCFPLN